MSEAPERPGLAIIAIDPGDDLPALRAWYERERIPAILQVPGVTGSSQWEVVSRWDRAPGGGMVELPAPPTYVVIFELADVAVARSEAFLDAAGRDFRLTATIDGKQVEYKQVTNITLSFVMESVNPEAATTRTEGMMVVAMTPEREWIPVLHEWYDTVHIPELMSCPGFLRTRRYESLDGIQNFFALYELDDPEALHTERFNSFSSRPPEALPEIQRRFLPHRVPNLCDIYRRLD